MKVAKKSSAMSAGGYGMQPSGTNQLNKKQKFSRFIYNKDEKKLCTRNKSDWGQFLFFFIIHILIVMAIYFTMYFTITRTMDKFDDKSYIEKTFDGDVPTLTIQPNNVNKHAKEQVMWYTRYGDNAENNRRIQPYINATTTFLKKMHNKCLSMGMVNCTFKKEEFGPCANEPYGYTTDEPCLYVKLNVRPKWEPMLFEHMPDDLPEELEDVLVLHESGAFIHCHGSTQYHDRHLGKIKYYPSRKFHSEYFPFKDGMNLSPVIAIQLTNVDIGYVLKLECDLYTAETPSNKQMAYTWIYLDIK